MHASLPDIIAAAQLPNLYTRLGVPQNATAFEIKTAYRVCSRMCHPDHTPGIDPRIFAGISEAYKILADPTNRERYNLSLQTGMPFSSAPPVYEEAKVTVNASHNIKKDKSENAVAELLALLGGNKPPAATAATAATGMPFAHRFGAFVIQNASAATNSNKTALECAETRDVARTMQQAIDDVLLLMRAAASGSENQVREQLDKGINANVRSPSDGSTALLEAAAGGHMSVCQMLLHRKADINACNNHNQSSLHAAGIAGHSAVCKLLIDNHADVSIASNDQCTEAHHRNKTALECAKDAQVATIMQMAIEHTKLVHTIDEMRALINQQAELIASLRKDHESLRQQFVEQPAAQQQRLLAHQLASGLRLANDMPPK